MKKCIVFIISVLMFGMFVSDKAQAKTEKNINAFEFYFQDEGNNTCCITEIRIKKDKGISELKIPSTINGKTVVSIGPRYLSTDHNDGIVQKNVFGLYQIDDCGRSASEYWDWMPKDAAQKRRAMKVKKIIFPDTIKVLKKDCFAAMKGIRSIQLPKNLKTIEEGAFAHTGIKKIHLPEGLTAIGKQLFFKSPINDINIPAKLKDGVADLARTTVSWKRFAVSKKNPYYKVRKGLLLSKGGKTLYATVTPQKNIRIPDSVKTIAEGTFLGASLKFVYLGAGVNKIQLRALSTKTRCKITLSPKNPYLVKSGMCIYHKKKRSLLVAIPKCQYQRTSAKIKKQKIYILRIPPKVKKLSKTMSTVGSVSIRKLYYPKTFNRISMWNISSVREHGLGLDNECVYFYY